jgi:hypothetical protein
MRLFGNIAIAMIFAVTAAAGYAKEMTLSELNAAGATLIPRPELENLINGATLRFTNRTGFPVQYRLDTDGKFYGSFYNIDRGFGMIRGTWQLAKNGRLCFARFVKQDEPEKYCLALAKVNEKFYIAIAAGRFTDVNISK